MYGARLLKTLNLFICLIAMGKPFLNTVQITPSEQGGNGRDP